MGIVRCGEGGVTRKVKLLGKVEVFTSLENQRFEPGFVADHVGNRLVNRKSVLAMQFVEVPGQNAHAGCVPEAILDCRVVQPTENFQLTEVIRKFVQQRRSVIP